jgi:hypothetical protein
VNGGRGSPAWPTARGSVVGGEVEAASVGAFSTSLASGVLSELVSSPRMSMGVFCARERAQAANCATL